MCFYFLSGGFLLLMTVTMRGLKSRPVTLLGRMSFNGGLASSFQNLPSARDNNHNAVDLDSHNDDGRV